jgi:oligo-alginate lyase
VTKTRSTLYPAELVARMRANAQGTRWGRQILEAAVDAAEAFLVHSDDEMWSWIIGPTLPRSRPVWSNGYCPDCDAEVLADTWLADPLAHPWKMQCPHCLALFPKNDFAAYYASGLDEGGLFQRARADAALLYNTEHPDPGDPLHQCGVDDGHGFRDGDRTWRFVGAYIPRGPWRLALQAVGAMADAFLLTGDGRYAHKVGVLLDRIADVWPDMDYFTQATHLERASWCDG